MERFIKIIAIIVILTFSGKSYSQSTSSIQTDSVSAVQTSDSKTSVNALSQDSVDTAKTASLSYSFLSKDGINKLIMMFIGVMFVFVSIKFNYQPLLLITIGMGMIIANIPILQNGRTPFDILEEGSFFNFFYKGLTYGIYPSLIFIGIGAMTDFSSLIANPKLMLLGAASQLGIFAAFIGAISLGFIFPEAASVGIIGGADGPISIFLSSKLAPQILVPIAIAAYTFMALVPVIQPPVMRLLTTQKERRIKMKPQRAVSYNEKIMFPVAGLILTGLLAPRALPILGMLFFGNILKESGSTKRLALTASNTLLDIVTILLGLTLGAAAQADVFLTHKTLMIFILGGVSFIIATAGGVLFAKFMNLFLSKENKINPLIGNAGVSALPDSARVSQMEGLRVDPSNHLLMHAMAPNVAGVIGSAIAAGILMSFLM